MYVDPQAPPFLPIVICCPADKRAVVEVNVIPLLAAAGLSARTHETAKVGDAARIARLISSECVKAGQNGSACKVVIAGGDGTAHEFIEGIYEDGYMRGVRSRWELALLPLGTVSVDVAVLSGIPWYWQTGQRVVCFVLSPYDPITDFPARPTTAHNILRRRGPI